MLLISFKETIRSSEKTCIANKNQDHRKVTTFVDNQEADYKNPSQLLKQKIVKYSGDHLLIASDTNVCEELNDGTCSEPDQSRAPEILSGQNGSLPMQKLLPRSSPVQKLFSNCALASNNQSYTSATHDIITMPDMSRNEARKLFQHGEPNYSSDSKFPSKKASTDFLSRLDSDESGGMNARDAELGDGNLSRYRKSHSTSSINPTAWKTDVEVKEKPDESVLQNDALRNYDFFERADSSCGIELNEVYLKEADSGQRRRKKRTFSETFSSYNAPLYQDQLYKVNVMKPKTVPVNKRILSTNLRL